MKDLCDKLTWVKVRVSSLRTHGNDMQTIKDSKVRLTLQTVDAKEQEISRAHFSVPTI